MVPAIAAPTPAPATWNRQGVTDKSCAAATTPDRTISTPRNAGWVDSQSRVLWPNLIPLDDTADNTAFVSEHVDASMYGQPGHKAPNARLGQLGLVAGRPGDEGAGRWAVSRASHLTRLSARVARRRRCHNPGPRAPLVAYVRSNRTQGTK